MKPESAEWVKKTEGDYTTASRERKAQVEPNYDASCFHAQQCAEKYLKARLVESGISFPKVHDLEAAFSAATTVRKAVRNSFLLGDTSQ